MKFYIATLLISATSAARNSQGFLNRLGVVGDNHATMKARADDVNDKLFVHAPLFTGSADVIPAEFDSGSNPDWAACR